MKSIMIFAASVLLSSCSNVVMEGPFPDTRITEKEMDTLRGTWQLENTVMYLNFTEAGNPILATVEWKDGEFRIGQHELHIVKRRDTYYLSLDADPAAPATGHLFAEIKPDSDGKIVAWAPDIEFFKEQVDAGHLEGTIQENDRTTRIRLTTPASQVLDLISTNPAAINYREPMILNRID